MRYFPIISSFTVGLACGIFGSTLVAQHPAGSTKIESQTEAVSILEDEVMSIVFRTDKMTFSAQRSKPAASFAVQVTYTDERPAQQCQVSSNLAGQLTTYSTITTKRQLQSQQQAEKDFPIQLGTLELRDLMEDEPTTAIRLRASSDRKTMAALYGNVAIEVSNPESAFANLEKGCHFLTGRVVP